MFPLAVVAIAACASVADEPPAPEPDAAALEAPARNSADEPLAESFSYDLAVRFADRAVDAWQDERRCVTCHTNGLYLIARPAAGVDAPVYRAARTFADDYLRRYVVDGTKPRGQYGSVEGIVATASFKAISDMRTTGELDDVTRRALDYAWREQAASGAWEQWLKCDWGPYEADDHFGVTLAAVAMGIASDDPYAKTPTARAGVRKLRAYLAAHPPENLHQTAMTLWASQRVEGIADTDTRRRWIASLTAAQRNDGGWAMVDLGGGAWLREDGTEQDDDSDAYATAFVAHVLLESGARRTAPPVARAITWLKTNQRAGGRWFTRSPRRDRKHYISHAATAFALLVLADEPRATATR